MYPLIGFFFFFLSIQNLTTYFELDYYLGEFISDVEGNRTKITKNGVFSYGFKKGILGYLVWYIFATIGFYFFILKRGASVFEGALYGSILCVAADFAIHSMFSRANNHHLYVILYDVTIVGALTFGISTFMWKTHKSLFIDYWFIFFLTFIITLTLEFFKVKSIEASPYIPPTEKLKETGETK